MQKKLVGLSLSLVILLSFSFSISQAAALTQEQIQAIVSLVRSFGGDESTLKNVEDSLNGRTPTMVPVAPTETTETPIPPAPSPAPSPSQSKPTSSQPAPFCYTFTRYLKVGDRGADVVALHKILLKEGFLDSNAVGGIITDEDNYFEEVTASAVVSLQEKYGITKTGTVGPKTRAALNAVYGCSATTNNFINIRTATQFRLMDQNGKVEGVIFLSLYDQFGAVFPLYNSNFPRTAVGDYSLKIMTRDFSNRSEYFSARVAVSQVGYRIYDIRDVKTGQSESVEIGAFVNGKYLQIETREPDKKGAEIFLIELTQNGLTVEPQVGDATGPYWNTNTGNYVLTSFRGSRSPNGEPQPEDTLFVVVNRDQRSFTISEGPTTPHPLPSVTVLSPNGGETFRAGDTMAISWKSVSSPRALVYLNEYYIDGNKAGNISKGILISDVNNSPNTGTFTYHIPASPFNNEDSVGGRRYKIEVCLEGGTCTNGGDPRLVDSSDDYFTLTSDSGTTDATATITGSPTLVLGYSNRNEVLLTATFNVSVSGGSQGVRLWTDSARLSFVDQNSQEIWTNSNHTSMSLSGTDKGTDLNGRNYAMIPAGKTVSVQVVGTINPKQMFAGTYHANLRELYAISPDPNIGFTSIPVSPRENSTNIKTIIGEVSPYISSVSTASSIDDIVVITGLRFNQTNNILMIGSKEVAGYPAQSSTGFTTILFTASKFGIPAGSYPLFVTNPALGTEAGKSNIVWVTIQGLTKGPLTVLSPNGGETWQKGTTQTIKWWDNGPVVACAFDATTGITTCPPPKLYDIKLVPYRPPCIEVCTAEVRAPYTIAKGVGGSSFSWSVGDFKDPSLTPPPDGAYTIQVCQSGEGTPCDSSDSYFKIVSGTPGNNPPRIVGIPAIPGDIKVGQSVSFSWNATDADNDDLSWSLRVEGPAGGSGGVGACGVPHRQNGAGWTYNANQTFNSAGTYKITATASDCVGGENSDSVTLQVGGSGGNLPPIVDGVSGPTAVGVNETGTWSVKAHDPENGSLSYGVDWGDTTHVTQSGGSANTPNVISSQTSTFTHQYVNAGSYTIKFTVTDNGGLVAQSSITVQVGNSTLVSTTLSLETRKDQIAKIYAEKITVTASEMNSGVPIKISSVSPSSAKGGSVQLSDIYVVYTPPAGYLGDDSFTVVITDGKGRFATSKALVQVTAKKPTTYLSRTVLANGHWLVTFSSAPNSVFNIEVSTDGVTWAYASTTVSRVNGLFTFEDLGPTTTERFYHLEYVGKVGDTSRPDLTITSVTFSPSKTEYAKNDAISAYITVKNIGNLESGPYDLSFSNKTNSWDLGGGSGFLSLKPNEEHTERRAWSDFFWANLGTNEFTATVDGNKKIVELNEDNNSKGYQFILINSTQPQITVVSPNGGEVWKRDTIQGITWSSTVVPPDAGVIKVISETDRSKVYIVGQGSSSDGSQSWQVGRAPNNVTIPDGQYRVSFCIKATNVCDESNSSFTITSGTAQGTLSASLTDANFDYAGIWRNFGPGVGNGNPTKYDWHVTAALSLPSAKTVKYTELIHKNDYEGWSTSLVNKIYGKDPYPLVVRKEGNPQVNSYDALFPLFVAGNHILDLYGQIESGTFSGATLNIYFTDGTSVSADVPASSIKPPPTNPPSINVDVRINGQSAGNIVKNGDAFTLSYTSVGATYCRKEMRENNWPLSDGSGYWDTVISNRPTSWSVSLKNDKPAGTTNTIGVTCFDNVGNSQTGTAFFTSAAATQPSITVLSPNGGEGLEKGKTYMIRWTSSDVSIVSIRVMDTVTGAEYRFATDGLSENVTASIGAYYWTVPQSIPVGSNYKVVIANPSNTSIADASNSSFTITAPSAQPSIAALSPTSGPAGMVVTVTGSNFGSTNTVLFNGTLTNIPSNGSSLQFTVPQSTPAGSYGVSVTNTANNYNSNTLIFTVTAPSIQPSITLLSPNGGEGYQTNQPISVSWNSTGLTSGQYVKVRLKSATDTVGVVLGQALASAGAQTITANAVPGNYTLSLGVYNSLSDTGSPIVSDESNSPFTITAMTTNSNTTLITSGGTASHLRDDFSGWVGFQFKVGSSAITVSQLGRYVASGSSGTHIVKLVNANGTDVSGGSVSVSTAGVSAGTYAYSPLPRAITLLAGTSYALVSQEFQSGSDQWYDDAGNTITTMSDVTPLTSAWARNDTTDYNFPSTGFPETFGPPNLKYTTATTASSGTSRSSLLGSVVQSLKNLLNAK